MRRKLACGYRIIRQGRVSKESVSGDGGKVPSPHEQELEQARDYYLSVLDEFPNPIWRTGPDGKTVYVNKAWLAFTGRTREQEMGDSWLVLVHPDDRERCDATFCKALASREGYSMEYRILHSDGTYHVISDIASPLYFQGEFLGHVGSAYDLQTLRESERRLTRINDLFAMLSSAGQAMLRMKDLESALQEMCEIAVRYGKFVLVIIALREEGTGLLKTVASSGPAHEPLPAFPLQLDPSDPAAKGLTVLCLREGRPVIEQDLRNQRELSERLMEVASAAGIRSAGVFPLWRGGDVVGTLNLYSDQVGYFEPDRVRLLEDLAGEISFAMQRLSDETERWKAEAELRKTLKRLQNLKEAVDESAIVLITDSEGSITYANQRTFEISGYSRDEMVGRNPRMMDSRRHPSDFFEEMWEIITAGGIWKGEFRNRSKSGADYWLDTTIVPFLDESGCPYQYMAISFDITARKLAEEKLQAISTDRMSLLDAASVARVVPWSMDIHSGSLRVGDSAFTVLGQPAAAFQAHPALLRELLKPDDQKLLAFALSEAKAGRTGGFEAPMKRGERQSIWSRWIVARREEHYYGVIQDITEQHDLHAQLLQSQKLESLGTLVGGITHDFNNILMGILGYTEVLSYTPDAPPSVQKGVDVIRRAAERGRSLVNQLLKFSHRNISTKVMASLNTCVTEVLELMSLPGDNRIKLQLELDPELPDVLMDAGQIGQVVLNLAVNARDAIPGEGIIRFRTGTEVIESDQTRLQDRRPGPYVFLDVEDTGMGMSPEIVTRIFEPFFTTKGVGKGTGLGLSVAHGIVEAHGGFLKCQSRLGQGTCFRILLPQVTTDTLPEDAGNVQAAPESIRILLLDEAGTARSTAAELLAYLGHAVVPLASVERALEVHRTSSFQLLVVNLDMEDGQGLSKLMELQAELSDVPVLAASQKKDPSLKGLRRSPHAIIRWPFQSVELISAIQRTLR